MGKPIPGYDVRIVHPTGRDCLPGEEGEVCIKATIKNKPCGLTYGYYSDEETNKNSWSGGYFHTGDTAYIDEHGNFKSSGYRIGPFEVESVLMEHPSVLEVAVTGVPDEKRGFVVKATIVLKEGYEGSEELIKELQNYVKTQTAPYKYPRIIEFFKVLPKTISGKIRRTEIRQNDLEKYSKK